MPQMFILVVFGNNNFNLCVSYCWPPTYILQKQSWEWLFELLWVSACQCLHKAPPWHHLLPTSKWEFGVLKTTGSVSGLHWPRFKIRQSCFLKRKICSYLMLMLWKPLPAISALLTEFRCEGGSRGGRPPFTQVDEILLMWVWLMLMPLKVVAKEPKSCQISRRR